MESGYPLVTIITPSFNRADYLRETIESVLAQDYPELEYIVLDDGSTDDTQSVLRDYEGRLYWEAHPNMGEARTVNKGWALAKGDFVGVVNSDDPLLPGIVSAVVQFMQANPDVLVVYPDWTMINADGKAMQTLTTYDYDFIDMLRWHHCMPGPGTFIRRSAFNLEAARDTEFRYVGDFEYWLRLGLHGRFARLPQTLATFRFHPGSASNAAKGRLMAEEHIRMMNKFYARSDLDSRALQVRNEAFSAAHYIAAVQCMNDRSAARRYFLKSILLHRNSRPNGLDRSWDLMLQFILPSRAYRIFKRFSEKFGANR